MALPAGFTLKSPTFLTGACKVPLAPPPLLLSLLPHSHPSLPHPSLSLFSLSLLPQSAIPALHLAHPSGPANWAFLLSVMHFCGFNAPSSTFQRLEDRSITALMSAKKVFLDWAHQSGEWVTSLAGTGQLMSILLTQHQKTLSKCQVTLSLSYQHCRLYS